MKPDDVPHGAIIKPVDGMTIEIGGMMMQVVSDDEPHETIYYSAMAFIRFPVDLDVTVLGVNEERAEQLREFRRQDDEYAEGGKPEAPLRKPWGQRGPRKWLKSWL